MTETMRYADPDPYALLTNKPPRPPFRPTYRFSGSYINAAHERYAMHPLKPERAQIDHKIPGNLLRADAAKLYELAYHCTGPSADIGTNRGLSAFVASEAFRDSGNAETVYTVDLNPGMVRAAKKNLAAEGVANVEFAEAGAASLLRGLRNQGIRLGFAFIDHSHYYEPVKEVCDLLPETLNPGSFVLFHDFIDGRNNDPTSQFDVVRAVLDSFDDRFTYYGGCGCTGIYRFGE